MKVWDSNIRRVLAGEMRKKSTGWWELLVCCGPLDPDNSQIETDGGETPGVIVKKSMKLVVSLVCVVCVCVCLMD